MVLSPPYTVLTGAGVSAESGLSRTRLGGALAEAMLARWELEAQARELALTGYCAVARPSARPRRYNRIARRIDSALERLGPFGRVMGQGEKGGAAPLAACR